MVPREAVFERIPPLFLQVYEFELLYWARHFAKIGTVATVKLRKPVEPLCVGDQRRVVGVRLTCRLDHSLGGKPRLLIEPADEANEEAIRRHVFDLSVRTLH